MENMEKEMILAEAIRNALDEYDIPYSERFVKTAVSLSITEKARLRKRFRRHPLWDEEKDAVIYPIELPPIKDEGQILGVLKKSPFQFRDKDGYIDYYNHARLLYLIINGETEKAFAFAKEKGLPHKKGQKNTRYLSAFFKDSGQWKEDNKPMQRNFTELCNVLNGLKTKLFISVNPAHLLTIANPHNAFMNSCHSLDSDMKYKAGNAGYLADTVTFVAFCHAGSEYTKKVFRQLFHYDDGMFIQNRLYTSFIEGSYGGVSGRHDASSFIRHAVQEVLANGEGVPNNWRTKNYDHDDMGFAENEGDGYADWEYTSNDPRVSVLKGYDTHKIYIGSDSICFDCGSRFTVHWETSNGLHCENCDEKAKVYCDWCNEYHDREDMRYIEGYGDICDSCYEDEFSHCHHCGEAHSHENLYRTVDDDYICDDCRDRYDYVTCSHCDDLVQLDDAVTIRNGNYVCDRCSDRHYTRCDHCGEYVPNREITEAKDGDDVCNDCIREHYEQCFDCGEYILIEEAFPTEDDGYPLCEDCHDKRQEEEENATA